MTTYHQVVYDGDDHVLVDMAKKAQKLNTARTINVTDADGTHSGTAASFDGSGNVSIKLPAYIKASLVGNATTATQAALASSAYEAGKLSTARTIQTDLASGS